MRNVSTAVFGAHHTLEGGLDFERRKARSGYTTGNYYDNDGEHVYPSHWARQIWTTKAALFLTHTWSFGERLAISTGLRADHQTEWRHVLLSPRGSLKLSLMHGLAVSAAAGVYYQGLPAFILVQEESHGPLHPLKATHYVVGLDWAPRPFLGVTASIYQKEYRHFPLEYDHPWLFVIDEGTTLGSFGRYYYLTDEGEGKARGVELVIHCAAGTSLHGVLSAALAETRYRDSRGQWHSRVFDGRYLLHATVAYEPGAKWQLSARWTITDGRPYTPFDVTLSHRYGVAILDVTRVNAVRLPQYHTLHVGIERRWIVTGSTIAVYLDVHNVYNRDNIARYYWDYDTDRVEATYEWGLAPVVGLKWLF